jgi:hypothetical protein
VHERLPDFQTAFDFLLESCVADTGGWSTKEIFDKQGYKPSTDEHFLVLILSLLREGYDWNEVLVKGNTYLRQTLIFTWLEQNGYFYKDGNDLIATNDRIVRFSVPDVIKDKGNLFILGVVDWLKAEKFESGIEVAGYSCSHNPWSTQMTFLCMEDVQKDALAPFELPLKYQRYLGVLDENLPEYQKKWLDIFKSTDDPNSDDEIPF